MSLYSKHLDYISFAENELVYDAVIKNLQIIGKAVKQIPMEIKDKYRLLKWRNITGLRDIVIHAYFSLEDETIWDIIQSKITPLQITMEYIINQENMYYSDIHFVFK
ncbi:MAG: DUF86 domain-containing protein [Cyanobacterium sp. T60_A2020_053]|nr:DUF86 domain-containing protein [Cyanobacterium sp. T60_A2020_053]